MKKRFAGMLAALALACQPGQNTTPNGSPKGGAAQEAPTRAPSPGGWYFDNPRPIGMPALALWGESLDNLYAVGPNGLVMRYDGRRLRALESGTRATLASVWGAEGTLFVVGEEGVILRANQGGPFTRDESGTSARLFGVWARSAREAYAVGEGGLSLRFDGSRWTKLDSGTTQTLRAVVGNKDAVFAVGEAGTLLRLDGAQWTKLDSGTDAPLLGAYADDTQVAVGGMRGVLLRSFDGKSFTPGTTDALGPLFVFWSEDGILYAAGPKSIARCPREACTIAAISGDPLLSAIARGPGAAFSSASGRVYTRVGETVKELIQGPRAQLNDLTTNGRAPLVASDQGLFERINSEWTLRPETSGAFLEAVSGNDTGDLAVGPAGLVLRRGADGLWYKDVSGSTAWLTDVYVPAHSDAYVVGHAGTVLHRKESGEWETLPTPTSYAFLGISGLGPKEAYLVGEAGTIYRYDGSSFTAETAPATEDLKAIAASPFGIFAVGKKGTILRREAGAWVREESGVPDDLYAIDISDRGEVIASGARGTILVRGASGTWTKSETETLQPLLGVTASADGFYAIGAGGVILRKPK